MNLAFVNDLDIVAVWVEHPCRIVARIVFKTSLRRFLALASGVHSRFVECIYLSMVFRYESNMHRLRIRLSFFEPEKSSFAVTKTLQIGMAGMAFVIYKVCDPKWLQGLPIATERSKSLTVKITWSIILRPIRYQRQDEGRHRSHAKISARTRPSPICRNAQLPRR